MGVYCPVDDIFALPTEMLEAVVIGNGNFIFLIEDEGSSLGEPELLAGIGKRRGGAVAESIQG